jgi:hypothetical protein
MGIVVTHMDNCIGYREFQAGLVENNVRFKLDLTADVSADGLRQQMQKYEVYLPFLMKTVNPEDYLKAAAFIQDSEALISRIQVLLDELYSPDPTSFDPRLESLYLTSRDDVGSASANPFEVLLRREDVVKKHPYRFHWRAATFFGLLGILYLSAGYLYERATIRGAEKILSEAMDRGAKEFSYRVQNDFYSYIADRKNSILNRSLIDFSPDHDVFLHQQIRDQYIRSVETKLLLPEINRLRSSESGTDMEKYLYLSGLAAATADNEMGAFICKHLVVWARITGLNELLIKDYVTNHSNTRYISPDLTHIMSKEAVQKILETPRSEDWAAFLDLATAMGNRSRIVESDLQELKAKASYMRREIQMLNRHSVTVDLLRVLSPKGRIDIGSYWRLEIDRHEAAERHPLLKLLKVIDGSVLARPDRVDATLRDLIVFAKGLKGADVSKNSIQVTFKSKTYTFDIGQWYELIRRSSILAFVTEYRTQSWAGEPWSGVLFGDTAVFNPIELNRIPGDDQLFAGESKVQGFFTMAAFKAQIEPLLKTLAEDIKILNLPRAESSEFDQFIRETLASYVDDYSHAYSSFYKAHTLRQFSPQLLPFVAGQIAAATSPVLALLKCVRDNTRFVIVDNNPYYAPFEDMRTKFQVVTSIIGKNPAKSPLWVSYQKLVSQLSENISNKAAPKVEKGKALSLLRAALTPYGRGALDAIHEVPGSAQVQLDAWLRSANLRDEWQDPLKDLFSRTLELGLEEIDSFAAQRWVDLRDTHYTPLLEKFPFSKTSHEVVSLEELREALHPSGVFWSEFNAYLSPLCERTKTEWTNRADGDMSVKLPADLLPIINRIQTIRDLLWDKKGKEQPLFISLRPLPLPITNLNVQPVMATLQVGQAAVFSFNQRAEWKTIKFEWWKPVPARLSVGFAEYQSASRHYAGVAAAGEQWSLMRLFQKARRVAGNDLIWFWTVASNVSGTPPTSIKFEAKVDPWSQLELTIQDRAIQ